MDSGQKKAIIQHIENQKSEDFIDVYTLINNTGVEDRQEAKEVLRELVEKGSVIPYPGSRYKVK